MGGDDEIRWRGTSSGQRSDDRRERLIAAAHSIVGRQGAAALAVRAVCRAANVSPRHFYECFADTDALLLATYERAVRELLDVVAAGVAARGADWAGRPVRERLRTVFDAAATHLAAQPESGRIIFREAMASDVLRTRAALTLPAFLNAVRRMALVDARAARAKSRRRHLEATLLSGGLAAVFTEWLSGTADFTRGELVDYCTDASLAVLGSR